MAYGEFGGSGSIAWKIDVEDRTSSGKKKAFANGYDDKNAPYFDITFGFDDASLAAATWASIKKAIEDLGSNAKKLVIRIPVESKNEDQIKIEW